MTAIRNILLPLGFLFVVLFQVQTSPIPTIEPLLQAHAHNDYEHERPLLDALAQGFTSVEADVHLIGKKLLVAHNARDIQADKTLQSLYLNPLRDIIRKRISRRLGVHVIHRYQDQGRSDIPGHRGCP